MPNNKYLSINEAAKYLGLSSKTLRRWEKTGKISSQRTEGGHRRYLQTDLVSFKKSHSKKALENKPVGATLVLPVAKPYQAYPEAVKATAPQIVYRESSSPELFKPLHFEQKRILRKFKYAVIFMLAMLLVSKSGLAKEAGEILNLFRVETGTEMLTDAEKESQVLATRDSLLTTQFNVDVKTNFATDVNIDGTLNLNGNSIVSGDDLSINPLGGGVTIGTGTPGDVDLENGDLFVSGDSELAGDLFAVNSTLSGTLDVTGDASAGSLTLNTETLTDFTGTGITIVNGALTASVSPLGDSIDTSEIVDGTVAEVDLNASNSATSGFALTYNSSTGGFTWTDIQSSITNLWTDGGATTYLTSNTDDLAIGGTTSAAPFFFDTSAGDLTIAGTITGGTLTDGTASITAGAGTGFVSLTVDSLTLNDTTLSSTGDVRLDPGGAGNLVFVGFDCSGQTNGGALTADASGIITCSSDEGGGTPSPWDVNGSNVVYLLTSTNNVTVGSGTDLAKLAVDGDTAGEIQFLVQGAGSQSANLVVVEDSTGADYLTINSAGNLAIEGTLSDISGNLAINDSVDLTGALSLTGDISDSNSAVTIADDLIVNNDVTITGGDINVSGEASDIEIADNLASSITISQGTNEYLNITTLDDNTSLTLDLPVAGSSSTTANLFTSNLAKAINLGTGTANDTISIGTGATGSDDINIGGNANATIDIQGTTDLGDGGTTDYARINETGDLSFVGAADTITGPGAGGLTVTNAGGNISLTTTTSGSILLTTGAATDIVGIVTGSLKVGNGTPGVSLAGGEAAYVESTLEVDGQATFDSGLRIIEGGGSPSFYTVFQGGNQSGTITYTLPTSGAASNDYVLTSQTDGTLAWQAVAGIGAGDITAVGNVIAGSAFTGSDTSANKGNSLIFEGDTSTDDANDLTLTAEAISGSGKTITLPNLTGTAALLQPASAQGATGAGSLLWFNETGGSAPNLLELEVGGVDVATIANTGTFTLAGTTPPNFILDNTTTGGDANSGYLIYRGNEFTAGDTEIDMATRLNVSATNDYWLGFYNDNQGTEIASLDESGNLQIDGDLTVSGGDINVSGEASDVEIADNTSGALTISQGANEYLNISTLDDNTALTLDLPVGGSSSTIANLFTSNVAKTINIGTGTLADIINIGNGGTTADTINIGNAATANTITIGNASATTVSITDDNWSITAAGIGTFTQANVDNLRLDGNTFSSTSGNIAITPVSASHLALTVAGGGEVQIDGGLTDIGTGTYTLADGDNDLGVVGDIESLSNIAIDNQGDLRLFEGDAGGSEYTGFQAPATLSSNLVYTLPSAGGSGDYVLTWQSGNILEWKSVTATGGAGDITAVGNDTSGDTFTSGDPGAELYFADEAFLGLASNGGRISFDSTPTPDEVNILDAWVGIGNSAPTARLNITPSTAAALTIDQFGVAAGETGELRFMEGGASSTQYVGLKSPDSLTSAATYTLPNHDTSSPAGNMVLTWQTGNVLEWKSVAGVGAGGDITDVGSISTGAAFMNPATADGQWLGLGAAAGRITFADDTIDEFNILTANVGIGTETPTTLLNVAGNFDLEGYGSIGNGAAIDADESLIVNRAFTATAANSAYQLHLGGNITENTSGTHTTIAPLAIDAITVTDGAGTEAVTNLASLYIAGAPTAGTTPANGPYAIFADAGDVRFDGLILAGTSPTTLTLASGMIDADAITLTTSGGAGAAFSNSGLESVGDGLTLLKGCTNNQTLKWDDVTDFRWECADDTTGATGIINVTENGNLISDNASTVDYLTDFDLDEDPDGEVNVRIDYTTFGTRLATLNIGEGGSNNRIDIGGVDSDTAHTLNLATNATSADVIAIGNNNAATTLALTGGDDWSITTAGAATFAEILTVNDDVDINLAAGENLSIAATAAPTADMLSLTNTGQATTADTVDGMFINFFQGADAAADTNSALQIAASTIGDNTSDVFSGLSINLTNASTADGTQRGLSIVNLNDAANAETEALIFLDNAEGAASTVENGILITSSGANNGIVDGLDVSDSNITNAINIGNNPIVTGNVAGTIGDGTTDSWLFTTDGTGDSEIQLPNDSIATAEILDNTITTTDLAASLVFADGDLINLSGINNSTTTEGLLLPQNATACSASTAEGQICWDSGTDTLYVGNNGGVTLVGGTGAGDILAVGNVTSGAAFTGDDAGGSPGNTLYFEGSSADGNEIALTGANATADQTITLPDLTGTVALLQPTAAQGATGAGSLLWFNETNGGAPNLLELEVGGVDVATIANTGTFTLAGTTPPNFILDNTTTGGDANSGYLIYRGNEFTAGDTEIDMATRLNVSATNDYWLGFYNDNQGTEIASLDESGNLQIDGDLTVSGGDASFGVNESVAGGLTLFSTGAGITDPTIAADATGDLNLTVAAAGLVNILTGNLQIGNGAPTTALDGEDAYIEGGLEVDGNSRFDGALTAFNTSTFTLDPTEQIIINATADNTLTSGVVDFDIDSATDGNIGLSLNYQDTNVSTAVTEYAARYDITIDANAVGNDTVYGQYIGFTQSDAGATAVGLYVTGEDQNYLSGNLGIGAVAANAKLHITPSTAAALQIDQYSTGAGATGELRLMEGGAGSTNYTGFKAADGMSTDPIYTLPLADAAADNYVLTSNGTGTLTWESVSSVGGIDISGTPNTNYATYWTDSNTVTGEADYQWDPSANVLSLSSTTAPNLVLDNATTGADAASGYLIFRGNDFANPTNTELDMAQRLTVTDATNYQISFYNDGQATEIASLDESGNLQIDGDLTVSGNEITFGNTESIDNLVNGTINISEDLKVTGNDITFGNGETISNASDNNLILGIGGTGELTLTATAVAPSTDSGLDLGTSSSQFADLYLDGGNISLDNATDFDIDDAIASALTISEGANNYLSITTSNGTEAMALGNASTNPAYSLLGTGLLTTGGDIQVNGGSVQLGVAGQDGQLVIYNELGVTDQTVTFNPSASQTAADITYTLPPDDGAADDYVLTTNGSGVLLWEAVTAIGAAGDITAVGDVASGAAFTATAGNDGNSLYFEGTSSDSNELQLTAADPGSDIAVTLPAIAGTLASLAGTQTFTGAKTFDDLTVADTNISFSGATTTFTTTGAFTLTPGGAVLLGDGGDTMQINSVDWDVSTTGDLSGIGTIAADGNITITKQDPTVIFAAGSTSDTKFWTGVTDDNGNDDDDLFQIGDGVTPGTNPFLTIDTSGNTGIGTAGADAKLDVLSASDEKLRLTETDGTVYTSFNVSDSGDLTIVPTGGDVSITGSLAISGGTDLGDAAADTISLAGSLDTGVNFLDAATGVAYSITGSDATGAGNAGGGLSFVAGSGLTTGAGGNAIFASGDSPSGTDGYLSFLTGGASGTERFRIQADGTFLFEKGANDLTLAVTAPLGGSYTLTIPEINADRVVCTTQGNCFGSGGGGASVLTQVTNALSKFTAVSGEITSSNLFDDGTNLYSTKTITDTGTIFDLNLTLGADANNDIVSALNIDVTSAATGDPDELYGINIGNLTSVDATVVETALRFGEDWQNLFEIEGTTNDTNEFFIISEDPLADRTYTIPYELSDAEFCLSSGNCAGVGGVGDISGSGTDNQIAYFTGTKTIASDANFTWDNTTQQFGLTGLTTETTGNLATLSSTANTITSGRLISAGLTSSSLSAAFTGDIGNLGSTRTYSGGATISDTGNILDLNRASTNSSTGTLNVTGAILNISNAATQSAGTLSDSANLVSVTQDADATGALIYGVANRSSNSNTLLFEQTAGGTDILSLQDDGDLAILGDLTVTGGTVLGAAGESIDLGVTTGDVLTFTTGGASKLGLSGTALYPTTDGGLALGIQNTNEWSNLYLNSAAVIGFDNTDITLTHSANTLTFAGGTLAFGTGTLLDLSGVDPNSASSLGFRLPRSASLSTTGPSGTDGYIAYDATADVPKYWDGSNWTDFSGSATTLEEAYNFDTDTGDTYIRLSPADDSLVFQNDTTGTDSAFVLQLDNIDTGVTTANFKNLYVTNAGATFDTTGGNLTNYGGYFANTATDAGTQTLTNVGLYATASGGDTNYAAIFDAGNVGIGTVTPGAPLEVSKTQTGSAAEQSGVKIGSTLTGSNTYDVIGRGFQGLAVYANAEIGATNSATNFNGIFVLPNLQNGTANTFTNVTGIQTYTGYSNLTNNADVTSARGLWVRNWGNTLPTTNFDNQYGIYIDAISGADSNYALYSAGGQSYFSGNVGIGGDTTPDAQLEVGNGTDELQVSSTGDITFVDADGAASITGPAGGALGIAAANSQALNLTTTTAGNISLDPAGAGDITLVTDSGSLSYLNITGLAATGATTALCLDVSNNVVTCAQGGSGTVTESGTNAAGQIAYFTTDTNITSSANWAFVDGATTGNSLSLAATTLTTGNLLDLTATYVDATGGTDSAIDINLTNTPSTSPNILRGVDIAFTDAGSLANTIYGIYADATTANGSDTTYAAALMGGNVGIGDASPASLLSVGNGDLFQVNSSGEIAQIDGVAHTLTDSTGNLALTSAGTSVVIADDLAVNGATSADITSSTTTATVFDTTVTTLGIGSAATTLNFGAAGALARAINIGTGTGIDTISIGTGGTAADVINIGGLATTTIDLFGVSTLGDGGTTNYASFSATGDLTFVGSADSITGPSGATLTVAAGAAQALTLTGNGASTWSTTSGNLSILANSNTANLLLGGGDTLPASVVDGNDVEIRAEDDVFLNPTDKVRLYANGAAVNCSGSANGGALTTNVSGEIVCSDDDNTAGTITLQSAYNNDADDASANILMTSGDGDIIFQTVAGTSFQVAATVAPTEDVVAITNSGQATTTTGVDALSLTFAQGAGAAITNSALNIAATTTDDDSTLRGAAINLTNASSGGTQYGMLVDNLASTGTTEALIALTNTDADTTVTDGILFTAGGAGTDFTDIIDLSAATGTNGINLGANSIIGTTPVINFDNFDVAADGNITVDPAVGIDTNAAGALEIGDVTATSVTIGTTAATTLNFGAAGALARAINIGTGTGIDTISIGTGGTAADVINIGGLATTTIDLFGVSTLGDGGTTNYASFSATGDLTFVGSADTITGPAAAALAINAANTALNLQVEGAIDVNIAGGSGATGCTIANATGNLTCSGTITGSNGTLASTLQNAYDNDTNTGDTLITLTTADDSLIFRNPAASGSDSAFVLNTENLATGVTVDQYKNLSVSSSGSFNTTGGNLTNYGAYISNTSTESAGANVLNNIGLYVTASGAENNYAAVFNGSVGVGGNPSELLEVQAASGNSIIEVSNSGTAGGDTAGVIIRRGGTSAQGVLSFWTASSAYWGTGLKGGDASNGYSIWDPQASDATRFRILGANAGFNTTAPDAALEINHATGDSLRLTYNDSDGSAQDYTDFSLDSAGNLTISPTTDAGTTPGTVTLAASTLATNQTTFNLINTAATTLNLGGAATTALNIGAGNTAYTGINIGTGTGGNVINIATNNTLADTVNIGSALDTIAGAGDFNFTIADTKSINLNGDGSPTADLLTLGAGDTSATDGVSALLVDFDAGDNTTTDVIDLAVSFTDDDANAAGNDTWNVIDINAFTATLAADGGATLTNTLNGFNIGNLTESVGGDETINSSAINIGSGWDANLFFNDTTSIIRVADTGSYSFQDSAGNVLATLTDNSNAGDLMLTGDLAINGGGLQLGVDGQDGSLTLFNDAASGGDWTVSFTPSATQTENTAYTLPIEIPTTSDYVLTTSNTGVLSWQAVTGVGDTVSASGTQNANEVAYFTADDVIDGDSSYVFIPGATTGNSLALAATTLTTGNLVDLTATYVDATGGTDSAIDINLTNTPSTSPNILRGVDIAFTDAGSLANTIYGIYADATTANGSDTTYAAALMGGNVGIGDATPDALIEALSTTEQLRLTHTDGTKDARFTVDTNGLLTIDTSTDGTAGSVYFTDNVLVGASTETLTNAGFVVDGDDLFVSGMAGIEGNVYTDGAFIAGATLTLSDTSIQESGTLQFGASGDSTNLLTLSSNATDLTLSTTDAANLILNTAGNITISDNTIFSASTLLDLSAIDPENTTAYGLKLPTGTSLSTVGPTTPAEGFLAYESDTNLVKIWDGDSWNSISGSTSTLQETYDAGGAGDQVIALDATQDSIIFRNPDATGTDSTFMFQLDNLDTTANAITDYLLLTTASSDTTGDAIDVSDTGFANALNVGDNVIAGTTAAINFANFDVAATGDVAVAAGTGIDTSGVGTLEIGDTVATTVSVGTTAATTLNLGAAGALTRAINIGTGTGADTIKIGTGITTADDIQIGGLATSTIKVLGVTSLGDGGSTNYAQFSATGNLTFVGSANTIVGPATFNLLDTASTTINFGGAATTALNIGTGTGAYAGINIGTGAGGNVINIATNNTLADTINIGSALDTIAGAGDFNFTIADTKSINLNGDTSPTADLLTLGAGDISATDGVSALLVDFDAGDNTTTDVIDLAVSFTDDDANAAGNDTWNVIDINAFTATLAADGGATLTNALNGFNIGNLTESVGGDETITSRAINIGSGWDNGIYSASNVTLADATLLDLSAILHDDTGIQGFKLPQSNLTTNGPSSGDGFLAFDTGDNQVKVWYGSAWNSISGSASTLQQAYEAGNSITTAEADGDIDFVLTDSVSDQNFDIDINADNIVSITRNATASAEAPTRLLLLENADTDITVTSALDITNTAGGFTNGILIADTASGVIATGVKVTGTVATGVDVSDTNITDALSVGDNNITGTDYAIVATTDIAESLTFTSAGGVGFDITGTAGQDFRVTNTGGSVQLNASEAAVDAIVLNASNAAGGIDINAGTGDIDIDLTGTGADFLVNTSDGAINLTAAGATNGDITLSAASDININGTTSSLINIGTTAASQAITIGNATANTSLAFNTGGTGSQTFTSAVTTGTTTTSAFVFNAGDITTGTGGYFLSDSITTGNLLQVSTAAGADTLTSGNLLKISSDLANSTFTGNLGLIDWSPDGSTEIFNLTADLLQINAGTYANVGNLLNITNDGAAVFSVSQTQITSAVPHQFTAAGDVTFAYDAVFTNQTAGTIKSYGPLTIASGESFENNNLTLKTYGTGKIVTDGGFSIGAQQTLPAGTTPSVGRGSHFIGNANGLITNFLDGTAGQILVLEFDGASTDLDCSTAGPIRCGTTDITTQQAAGDIIMFVFDGTNWNMIEYVALDADSTAGADIAEWFPTNGELAAGEVVSIDGSDPVKVQKGLESDGSRVVGVVSTQPGIVLGVEEEGVMAAKVALAGRAPVKVDPTSEAIANGDLIGASSTAGMAKKINSGWVIGRALEAWTPDSGVETVTIFVNPIYVNDTQLAQTDYEQRITTLEDNIALLQSEVDLMTGGGETNTFEDMTINNLTVLQDTVLSNTVINGKLNIGTMQFDNVNNSIDAIGTLKVQPMALGNIEFQGGQITFDTNGNVTVQTITANKYKVAGASAGTATLTAGETFVDIESDQVTAESLILVTPKQALAYPLAVTEKTDGVGFRVSVQIPESYDVEFDWFIVDHLSQQ